MIEKAKARSKKSSAPVKSKETTPPTKRLSSRKTTNKIHESDCLTGSVSISDSSPQTLLVNYTDLDEYSTLYLNDSDVAVSNNEDLLSVSPSDWPTFSMFPSLEELGTNCFLNNFVAEYSGPSHGYFNYCKKTLVW